VPVRYDVPLVGQANTYGCWSASIRMMMEWRKKRSPYEVEMFWSSQQGKDILELEREGWDMPPTESAVASLAATLEWYCNSPRQFPTLEKLQELLLARGPVWWAGKNNDFISVGRYHAVVLTGVREVEGELFLQINDPWPVDQGTRHQYVWENFLTDLPGLGLMSFP
jgi:hypothetical protein